MKIIELLQNTKKPFFSLEFFPPKNSDQWPDFFSCVEKLTSLNPLFASVTYGAGGSSQNNTLEIAKRLRQMNLEPLVHLTCVGANAARINEFLQNLRQCDIDNVLALRGDPPKGQEQACALAEKESGFRYAEDLVRYMRRVEPSMGVAVAGYPAPHPQSPSFALDRAYTLSKIRAGADFVVTQVFFDVREYFDFVDALRQAHIYTPVIPGVLPIQSLASLKTLLSMCGANIPGKLYLELEAAHAKGGEEAVREAGLTFAISQIRQLIEGGAPGIHLYTLNKADLCLKVAEAVKPYMA